MTTCTAYSIAPGGQRAHPCRCKPAMNIRIGGLRVWLCTRHGKQAIERERKLREGKR